MKKLHTFTIDVETKVKRSEDTIEDGQKVTKIKEVTEKVPHTIVLKRPARHENDALRLFYGGSINRGVENGLMLKSALINKHIDGVGALLSKETAKRLVDLAAEVESAKNEIQLLSISDLDATEKRVKSQAIFLTMIESQRELQAIESSNQTVFNNTAEAYAQERSVLWLILMQTYIEVNGKTEPFFKGADFEKREEYSFDLDDKDDPVYLAAREWIVTYWGYYGRGLISDPKDFAELEKKVKDQIAAESAANEPAPEKIDAPAVETAKEEPVAVAAV